MADIIVGIDGSANAAAALRWAVAEAELRPARVTAVFAWGYVPPGHPGDGRTFEGGYDTPGAEAALARAVEAAVGIEAAAGITRRAPFALPADALLADAEQAELLVVGARGIGGLKGLMLGSVCLDVLHRATRPLAVVPHRADVHVPSGRVVVGIDDSESARRALRWATDEARRRRARLDMVHAWHPSYVTASPVLGMPLGTGPEEGRARAVLDRAAVADAGTRGGSVAVDRLLVRGTPARAVLDVSRGADLLVLGARGRSALTAGVLGSVTSHVARHTCCPLVVVR